MKHRPKLGEILLAAGVIDEFQLKAALGEQKRWGRRLGVTLIKLGMVEEGHLIRALARQLDLPVASLAGKRIPDQVIDLVPARMASEHGVIPLFTKDEGPKGQLFVGMEDPSNLAALDDLSFRTGMEIRPVMVGPSELGEALDRYYCSHEGGSSRRDPFRSGDAMGTSSLRVVMDDSPHPGTVPLSTPEPIPAATSATPEALVGGVAPSIEQTQRAHVVAEAIAALLIERGFLTRDELEDQIARQRDVAKGVGSGPTAE